MATFRWPPPTPLRQCFRRHRLDGRVKPGHDGLLTCARRMRQESTQLSAICKRSARQRKIAAAAFPCERLQFPATAGSAANNLLPVTPVEARDQAQIELYGVRVGSTIQAHEICDEINVAPIVAQTILQRQLYVRAQLRVQAVVGILPARSDGHRDDQRRQSRACRLPGAHRRDRRRREGLAGGHGGGIDGRRLDAGALSVSLDARQRGQPRRRRRAGQSAADLRAAAGADRRRGADLGRRLGRNERRRRSELGRRATSGCRSTTPAIRRSRTITQPLRQGLLDRARCRRRAAGTRPTR